MTNHDLYRAIGEADETFLLECEQSLPRRSPRHLGIIAALVALMLTACAPAAIRAFNAIKGTSLSQTDEIYEFYELESSVYEIWVDIDIAQDAPTTIETAYLPIAMENYGESITVEQKEWSVSFYCMSRETSAEEYVDFHQSAYPAHTRNEEKILLGKFYASPGNTPQIREITFEDTVVLDIIQESHAHKRESGAYYLPHRTVFWSDGYYLFFMNLPTSWNDDQIKEMISSLTPVEDISQYLTAQ